MATYHLIRTNPYENDPRVISFRANFAALDRLDDKKRMRELVETAVKHIASSSDSNNKYFYKIFIPLFNTVKNSVLLAEHAYPKIDKVLHIIHTKTKLKLLNLIRQTAVDSVKKNIINTTQEHSSLTTDIKEAVAEPLFALKLSNWRKFFQLPTTDAVYELRQCITPRQTILRQTWP